MGYEGPHRCHPDHSGLLHDRLRGRPVAGQLRLSAKFTVERVYWDHEDRPLALQR